MASRRNRLAITLVTVIALTLAAILGVRAIYRAAERHFADPHCTVGEYEVDTGQASVAARMVGAVAKYRPALPDRAAVLALAAALQESKLRNIAAGDGDRDSVGVLQQRPSQGWGGGDPAKLADVTIATHEFLAALVKVKNWQTLPAAEAIQDVQISADGSLYAQHEPEATALATALLGRTPAAITCTFDKPTQVATTAAVITQLRYQLPVATPSASGRVITVPGAAWQTAAWFVANADRLGVDSVAYDGRRWSRAGGWVTATAAATAVLATMATV